MSGGKFDYKQNYLYDIADEIDRIVASNGQRVEDEWGDGCGHDYPPDIIVRFKETAHTLRRAAEMVQRVDWLVQSDDGEDSFRRRWKKEVRAPFSS